MERKIEALKRSGDKCFYCSVSLNMETVTIDHVIPTSIGGSDSTDNIVAACIACNNLKSDIDYETFIKHVREENGVDTLKQLKSDKDALRSLPKQLQNRCGIIKSLAAHIQDGFNDDFIYEQIDENMKIMSEIFARMLELKKSID